MALIQCMECQKEVSDNAAACPACGNPIKVVKVKPPPQQYGCGTFILLLFVMTGIIGILERRQPEIPPIAKPIITPHWAVTRTQGRTHFVYMEPAFARDEQQYLAAADKICTDEDVCIVMFWQEWKFIPKALPMSDEQLDAQTAQWNSNTHTNFRRLIWSCKIRNDPDHCFSPEPAIEQ